MAIFEYKFREGLSEYIRSMFIMYATKFFLNLQLTFWTVYTF